MLPNLWRCQGFFSTLQLTSLFPLPLTDESTLGRLALRNVWHDFQVIFPLPMSEHRTNDETALGFVDHVFVTYVCSVKNNAPQVFDLFFSLRKKRIFKAAFGASVSDNSILNLDLYKKFCTGVCFILFLLEIIFKSRCVFSKVNFKKYWCYCTLKIKSFICKLPSFSLSCKGWHHAVHSGNC